MPTPVGPVARDPDDPDFWDWGPSGEEVDDRPNYERHPAIAIVAIVVIGALLLLLFVSIL